MADDPTQAPDHAAGAGRARGRAARKVAPRSSHGDWAPAEDRVDPVDRLVRESAGRVQELVPIRWSRMLASPFAFLRGSASVMAADLADTPVSGFDVQLCGDAHLANFGAFAAPDRTLVFDVNDFDETHPGPWEWDVKRLAASTAVLAAHLGLTADERDAATAAVGRGYRTGMRQLAALRTIDVWYQRLDVETLFAALADRAGAAQRRRWKKAVTKAERKTSVRALAKLAHTTGDVPRIVDDPPLIERLAELVDGGDDAAIAAQIDACLTRYRSTLPVEVRRLVDGYSPVDVARKVVGVGSVGTRALIVLLLGRDDQDPLFLQLKEAGPSTLEAHLPGRGDEEHGRRVVEGQKVMQAAGDTLLGWLRLPSAVDGQARSYYVRQLWDEKGSVDLEALGAAELAEYARVCALTLARAHARSGDRFAIAGYLGSGTVFDAALTRFAARYAEQTAADHAALAAAAADGRIVAAPAGS